MLIVYLHQTFGLGDNVELYGHGVEVIAVALKANETNPVIRGVTAFPPVHEQEEVYQRIVNLIRDDVNLQIDIAYNPYEFGREGIEDFLAEIKDLGLDVETYEMIDSVISDGSIPEEMLVEMEDQLLLDRAYAREYLDLTPPGITVYIGNDPEWLTSNRLEAWELDEGFRPWITHTFTQCESVAEAGFYVVFVSACHPFWDDPVHRRGILSHEWWHTVQHYLLNSHCCTGSDRMQHVGPGWLMEGSAEVWAKFVVNGVDFDLEREIAWRREYLGDRLPADFNLLHLNSRKGFREASDEKYVARDLAAFMLMNTSGWQSFLDFYGSLGDYYATEAAEVGLDSTRGFGDNPELSQFSREFFDTPERLARLDEVFQNAFGRTMEEFAKEFRDSLR